MVGDRRDQAGQPVPHVVLRPGDRAVLAETWTCALYAGDGEITVMGADYRCAVVPYETVAHLLLMARDSGLLPEDDAWGSAP
jgi:hypothetical protein